MTAALGPEYIQDPHAVHAWLVTRYADVRAALADPRLIKESAPVGAIGTLTRQ